MPIAEGNVRQISAGRLVGSFNVHGSVFHLSAAYVPVVQNFNTNNATVTYTDVRDLTNTRTFAGNIGPNKVNLIFQNGPVISGFLDFPISPGASVNGAGSWVHSFNKDNPHRANSKSAVVSEPSISHIC